MPSASDGKKVKRVLKLKLSNAGWKTVRSAIDNWGRTMRFAVVVLVLSLPTLALVWISIGR